MGAVPDSDTTELRRLVGRVRAGEPLTDAEEDVVLAHDPALADDLRAADDDLRGGRVASLAALHAELGDGDGDEAG